MTPLKQWLYEEAARCQVDPDAIRMRIRRGKYPDLKIEHVPGKGCVVFTRSKHAGTVKITNAQIEELL